MKRLKKKLEAYLQYIKTELVMDGYLDGWTIIGNPIPNKYFAITKFKFVKNSPYKLSILIGGISSAGVNPKIEP